MQSADSAGLRAGLYQRVSVLAHGADARSVAEQNDANAAACTREGWVIAEQYADPGRSASRFARKHREEYGRLVADLKAGKLDVLVLWEPSRGSRELEEWARLLNICRGQGTRIYITQHDHLYDLTRSREWRSLAEDGVKSASDSEETSDRVNRAMRANAAAGRPHGKVLWGYQRTYDPRSGALAGQDSDPGTAPLVTEIITRVAAGDPQTAIAKDMDRRGVPGPAGGRWNTALIRRIAANRAYIGRRIYNGAETPAIWPPLVTEDVFWRAQRVLGRNGNPGFRPGAAKHLLSYLAKCGPCTGPLCRLKVNRVACYTCQYRHCVTIRQDWLDAYVTGVACGLLDDPAFWDGLAASGDEQAVTARAEADRLRAELREYVEMAKARKITPGSFAEIEASYLDGIAAADARAAAVAAPPSLSGFSRTPEGARRILEAMPVALRKQVFRDLFTEITLLPAKRPGRQAFDPERVRIVPR